MAYSTNFSDFDGTTECSTSAGEDCVEEASPIASGSFKNLEHLRKCFGQEGNLIGYQKRLAHIIKTIEAAENDSSSNGKEYALCDLGRGKEISSGLNWAWYKDIAAQKMPLTAIKEVFRVDEDVRKICQSKSVQNQQGNVDVAFDEFGAFLKRNLLKEDAIREGCKPARIPLESLNISMKSVSRYLAMFKKTFSSGKKEAQKKSESDYYSDSD